MSEAKTSAHNHSTRCLKARASGKDVHISRNAVAVATRSEWVFDFAQCPRGAKMLLLTESRIAVLGLVGSDTKGYIAWAPLPDVPKHMKTGR